MLYGSSSRWTLPLVEGFLVLYLWETSYAELTHENCSHQGQCFLECLCQQGWGLRWGSISRMDFLQDSFSFGCNHRLKSWWHILSCWRGCWSFRICPQRYRWSFLCSQTHLKLMSLLLTDWKWRNLLFLIGSSLRFLLSHWLPHLRSVAWCVKCL